MEIDYITDYSDNELELIEELETIGFCIPDDSGCLVLVKCTNFGKIYVESEYEDFGIIYTRVNFYISEKDYYSKYHSATIKGIENLLTYLKIMTDGSIKILNYAKANPDFIEGGIVYEREKPRTKDCALPKPFPKEKNYSAFFRGKIEGIVSINFSIDNEELVRIIEDTK